MFKLNMNLNSRHRMTRERFPPLSLSFSSRSKPTLYSHDKTSTDSGAAETHALSEIGREREREADFRRLESSLGGVSNAEREEKQTECNYCRERPTSRLLALRAGSSLTLLRIR